MEPEYEMETVYEVWNNKTGEAIEVGPDRDALGLIEIRYKSGNGDSTNSITMTTTCAELVVNALSLAIKTRKEKDSESNKEV